MVFWTGCGWDDGEDNGGGTDGGGGGGGTTVPTLTILNNTGFQMGHTGAGLGLYIKPAYSTDWGNGVMSLLRHGESVQITLSHSLANNNVFDFFMGAYVNGQSRSFRKYGVVVSRTMTIEFTPYDLYFDDIDFPTFTVQNRTGANASSYWIRPSGTEIWSRASTFWGSISNNGNSSGTIGIPLSRFSAYDVQIRTSAPDNTFTIRNVNITNGTIVMFTRAHSDNALSGLPIIVINNNTGQSIGSVRVKASSSSEWENWQHNQNISAGASRTFMLPRPLSTNSTYDIQLRENQWMALPTFTKTSVSMSEGLVVNITAYDLD
jgi:hypothetical protein